MRAMILAAGLGTRLRPLTNVHPKALVEVGGRPMLDYSLDLFERAGIKEVIINIHHFADQMRAFIAEARRRRGLQIEIQDESQLLLGSGGGIAQARSWLFAKEELALIWNPDGLLFPDLARMQAHHQQSTKTGNLATMVVLSHPDVGTKFHPVYCKDGKVCGFGRDKPVADAEALHFAGAYILQKTAAELLPPPGTVSDIAKEVWFPIVRKAAFAAFRYDGPYQDLGTPVDVELANQRIAGGEFTAYFGRKG